MKNVIRLLAVVFTASVTLTSHAQSNPPVTNTQDENPTMLNPFLVNGSGDQGYFAGNAVSATRINTGIHDLPFSITAFTPQFIVDTGSLSLLEIVSQSAGVKSAVNSSTQGNGLFSVRGFIQSPQRNGFSSNSLTSNYIDASVVDRVEIVKGPASLLYGAIAPGGTVNYITKAPQEKAFAEVQLFLGSYSYEKAILDINQPLINNKLLFRFIGAHENGEQYIEHTKTRALTFFPSATWKITPRVSLTVDFQSYENREAPPGIFLPNSDVGTPASFLTALYNPGYPSSSSLLSNKTGPGVALGIQDGSDPGFIGVYPGFQRTFNMSDINDVRINNLRSLNVELNVQTGDHWSTRAHYVADNDLTDFGETGTILARVPVPDSLVFSNGVWSVAPSWLALTPAEQIARGLAYANAANNNLSLLQSTQNGTPSPILIPRNPRYIEQWLTGSTFQVESVGSYEWAAMKLQLLGGVFYDRATFNARTTQNKSTAASPFFRTWDVNPASPTYYVNYDEGAFNGKTLTVMTDWSTTRNADYAIYGLVNATLFNNRLHIVGGARYNDARSQNTDNVAGVVSRGLHAHYTTPQLGVGYKFTPDLMWYASYSESYTLSSQPFLSVIGVVNGIPSAIPTTPTSPTIGKGYETGIKAAFFDNRLNATLSVFQIENDRVVQRLSSSINGFGVNTWDQGAKQRGRGVEGSITWSIQPNWQVIASASEEDVRNVAEPPSLPYYLGQVVGYTAKTQANLWTRYNFTTGPKGMWIGGGVNYTGRNAADPRNVAYFLPAYTVYNSAIGYDWVVSRARMSVALNFKNMGNTYYRPSPNSAGEPRRFLTTFTLHY